MEVAMVMESLQSNKAQLKPEVRTPALSYSLNPHHGELRNASFSISQIQRLYGEMEIKTLERESCGILSQTLRAWNEESFLLKMFYNIVRVKMGEDSRLLSES